MDMSEKTDFEDDFDAITDMQPSGTIHVAAAPELSQGTWYDLVDDLDDLPQDLEEEIASRLAQRDASSRSAPRLTAHTRPTLPIGSAVSAATSTSGWRKWFSLRFLIVFCALVALASGAAVAFARNAPSSSVQGGRSVTQQAQPTPVPTRAATQPAPTSTSVAQGPSLPPEWTASGRGTADMVEALSVAETFTQRYETIDARSPATLNAARFILTSGANARFATNDKRATDAFLQQIKQQQLIQAALVTNAQLVKVQTQNGRFFAWVRVSYQLEVQQGQGPAMTMQNLTMSVLLVASPFGTPADAPPMGGIGWLVSNYSKGNTLPNIPA